MNRSERREQFIKELRGEVDLSALRKIDSKLEKRKDESDIFDEKMRDALELSEEDETRELPSLEELFRTTEEELFFNPTKVKGNSA